METKGKNPHAHHRQRVRDQVRANGFDGMADHNVLEFLLFYAIPRRDTNELAHLLIDRFGSLAQVLDAPVERLTEVDGIGESAALLLTSVSELNRRLTQNTVKGKPRLETPEEIHAFLQMKYRSVRREVAYLLCLDESGRLLNCCKLGEGNADAVLVDKRTVLETALRNDARVVVMAHNHPNGIAAPSREDLTLTEECARMLRTVGIRLADHVIVAGEDFVSLASIRKFRPIFL